MKSKNISRLSLSALPIAVLLGGAVGDALAQNCSGLPAPSDFTVQEIAIAAGWPYDIQADKTGRVYWIERMGAFKVWNPADKSVKVLKQFDVMQAKFGSYFGDVENGLEGMALDANFEATQWVYIWRTLPASQVPAFGQRALGPVQRLSRYTLKAGGTELDDASEKPIFEHKIYAQCCHFGGALRMGKDGVLHLSTGDNIHYNQTGSKDTIAFDQANNWGDPRSTSSNTNDTRGKILRIKPIPFPDAQKPAIGVGSTYTIPPGNLKETWATAEKDKVRPEIYSMGHRNPFTITLHPEKGWVGIGEASGTNGDSDDDEINIVTKAGFFGWPFLQGDNRTYIPQFWSARGYNPGQNAATGILNNSPHNTGAQTLPPATAAAITVRHGGANMPIYCHGVAWGWVDYDPANPNRNKFPPYLKGKLLVSGYGESDVRAATVDDQGRVTKLEVLFPLSFGKANGGFTTDVLRASQGPDGSFYVGKGVGIGWTANNACKIFKISYKGDCSTVSLRPDASKVRALLALRQPVSHLGHTEVTLPAGIRRARAYDLGGKAVWETSRASDEGTGVAVIPASVPAGALKLRYFAE